MGNFVYLHNSERGQVVAVKDADEDGDPCIRYGATPPGLGVCWMTAGWTADGDGWNQRDTEFSMLNAEKMERAMDAIFDMAKKFNVEDEPVAQ